MTVGMGSLGLSSNFFAKKSELVGGNELEEISKELFEAAGSYSVDKKAESNTAQRKINLSKLNKPASGLKMYGVMAEGNVEAAKRVAVNQAGLNLNLSNTAMASIAALNAKAAVQPKNIFTAAKSVALLGSKELGSGRSVSSQPQSLSKSVEELNEELLAVNTDSINIFA